MHQQMRAHQRASTSVSATPPPANTSRVNNTREGGTRSRAGSALSSRDVAGSPTSPSSSDIVPAGDSVRKLDQIIQNIHGKVAGLVLSARMTTTPSWAPNVIKKTNKWFQLETDEFDDFRDELRLWRTCGSFENRPPPLFIEVYLDTSTLKSSETLVLVDSVNNKRWDVVDGLNTTLDSPTNSTMSGAGGSLDQSSEVILERWRIELKSLTVADKEDFGPTLPTIYKKAIVFIRSIFTFIHVTPCWRLVKQSRTSTVHPALVPRCRIRTAEPECSGLDSLRKPITMTGNMRSGVVQEFVFGDLDVPVGRIYASVTYRIECGCNFRVDDAESILSSRFMGIDENFFAPSVPRAVEGRARSGVTGGHHGDFSDGAGFGEIGSLPTRNLRHGASGVQQTYGSLSTFHGDGPLGTSPISALRAVRPPGSDTSSPPNSMPSTTEPEIPHSLPSAFAGRTPFRSGDGHARRTSVSFQPFKGGPISASPAPSELGMEIPSSPHSVGRVTGVPTLTSQGRDRRSLTAGMPASLRGIPQAQPQSQEQTLGTSPRNTALSASGVRYSSSFSHRRNRPSIGGMSRTGDDEQGSSGRQSLSSSIAQPGSGLLTEASGAGSGSLQVSDDNIEEFLKVLDSKRNLKSFEPPNKGDSAINRTAAQLSKFHMMKESNAALGESLTSSMQMQRSSSSSSRQLTNVPGMAPASMSTSSSPGKPLSPHTPHTPAIPSRLSENSIVEHDPGQQARGVAREPVLPQIMHSGPSRESTFGQDGTTAIDIPLSPRIGIGIGAHARRPSSVAQQPRVVAREDDTDPELLANRSLSLGADDREPPTISALLCRQTDGRLTGRFDPSLGPAAELDSSNNAGDVAQPLSESKSSGTVTAPAPSTSPFGRRRYVGMCIGTNASAGAGMGAGMSSGTGTGTGTGTSAFGGRGQTPPHSSRGSFVGSSGRNSRGGYNETTDEEPLVFDMSEMDAQVRRSLEDGRGGGATGSYLGRRAW